MGAVVAAGADGDLSQLHVWSPGLAPTAASTLVQMNKFKFSTRDGSNSAVFMIK